MTIYRHQELCNQWKSLLNSYPSSAADVFQQKRLKGMSARLGGEPGGAQRVSYASEANENVLVLFSSNSASRVNKNMKAA
jgi:hypothetical protein